MTDLETDTSLLLNPSVESSQVRLVEQCYTLKVLAGQWVALAACHAWWWSGSLAGNGFGGCLLVGQPATPAKSPSSSLVVPRRSDEELDWGMSLSRNGFGALLLPPRCHIFVSSTLRRCVAAVVHVRSGRSMCSPQFTHHTLSSFRVTGKGDSAAGVACFSCDRGCAGQRPCPGHLIPSTVVC